MSDRLRAYLFRGSAVLWVIWGVFHLALGVALVWFIGAEHPSGQLESLPAVFDVEMAGNPSQFATIAFLKQHTYNLAWIGLVVTVGAVWVWRGDPRAVFFNAIIAGFADLGYFAFVDLAGYADPPGPQMTYICVSAIVLSLAAYLAPALAGSAEPEPAG